MFHEGYVDLSPEGQISLNIEEALFLKQQYNNYATACYNCRLYCPYLLTAQPQPALS